MCCEPTSPAQSSPPITSKAPPETTAHSLPDHSTCPHCSQIPTFLSPLRWRPKAKMNLETDLRPEVPEVTAEPVQCYRPCLVPSTSLTTQDSPCLWGIRDYMRPVLVPLVAETVYLDSSRTIPMNLGGRKLVSGSLSCKVIVLRPSGTELLRGYSAEYPST